MLETLIIFLLFLSIFAVTFEVMSGLLTLFVGIAALLMIARYITRSVIEY